MTRPSEGVMTYTSVETGVLKGNLATSKDSDTGETSYTFDGFSRLRKMTHPDTAHVDIDYDDADRVTSIKDERGNAVGYAYDDNNNVTVVTDPAGKTTQLGYDALAQIGR